MENQLTRYGAIAKGVPFTTGKTFFVVQSTDKQYSKFANAFPPDDEGVVRVYTTIQSAVTAVAADTDPAAGHVILVKPGDITDMTGDPTSYAETVIIPATCANLTIKGMFDSRTQGGLPQIKKGSGAVAQITIRAPGCTIDSMGINGIGATGGGILLDDDTSTKTAFGTTIRNCHFKNCVGTTATNAATGGAIMWSSTGGSWQVLIKGNRFYKNVGDIVLLGTSLNQPQDVIIEDNIFSGPAASVDCNLFLSAGSGMNGVIIRNNEFTAMPAIGAGTNARFAVLTGCTGMMVGNSFATSTTLTFGATGTGAIVPVTVFMPKNYRETTTGVSSEVFRT